MKNIGTLFGDVVIPSSGSLADRVAILIFACIWLMVGAMGTLDIVVSSSAEAFQSNEATLWIASVCWVSMFLLIIARLIWTFFGNTKVSISSTGIFVTYRLGVEAIYKSRFIQFSKIANASIEEVKFSFKGNKQYYWALFLTFSDGKRQKLLKFNSAQEAEAFGARFLTTVKR